MNAHLYKQICTWNAARYERTFDRNLAAALLAEEFVETQYASNMVETIDGYCDILYVACGGLWKLDASEAIMLEITLKVAELYQWDSDPDDTIAYSIAMLLGSNEERTHMCALHTIVVASEHGLLDVGLTEEQIDRSTQAVCTSNSTKPIKRYANNIKATAKGEDYTSPAADLSIIAGEVHDNRKYAS